MERLGRLGTAWKGLERLGRAWKGLGGLGKACRVLEGLGRSWMVLDGLGWSWHGLRATLTAAWQSWHPLALPCQSTHIRAMVLRCALCGWAVLCRWLVMGARGAMQSSEVEISQQQLGFNCCGWRRFAGISPFIFRLLLKNKLFAVFPFLAAS